ncbi:unnamed protein product, partial [Vitis vinifera]|uniref:Uncharacterized protein n=1 Tax=Vitis vinifera TaxID=29760 RepID=D7SNL5_VITVI
MQIFLICLVLDCISMSFFDQLYTSTPLFLFCIRFTTGSLELWSVVYSSIFLFIEWALKWFYTPGIPHTHCNLPNSSVSVVEECFRGTPRIGRMKNEIKQTTL